MSSARNMPGHRLAEVPLFAALEPEVLDDLARSTLVRRFSAGQVLWTEGDPGEALALLEEGKLRVSRFTSAGAEAVLAVVEAPAALGELALLDGRPRDATVVAQSPVVVRMLPRQAFLDLLEREPDAARGLLSTIAGWVRHANQRHADLVGLDVPGRLATWLLRRAGDATGSTLAPRVGIELGRSQGDLAAELGTTRESLNRALRTFVEFGLVEVQGERVTLVDPAGLAAYTN